jgi:hypothetical protein
MLLVSLSCSTTLVANELIGVLPLTNQRYHNRDDWLGYYIQSRIRMRLSGQQGWLFHSRQVVQFWIMQPQKAVLISPDTTIQLTGSFQRVYKLGRFNLRVRNFKNTPYTEREFTTDFKEKTLDVVIDGMADQVGAWISKDYQNTQPDSPITFDSKLTADIFRLREELLNPAKQINFRGVNWLSQQPGIDNEVSVVEDLVESLLILSRKSVPIKSKTQRLKIAELLKKNFPRYPNSARLKALQAEFFYFSKNFDALERTATQAIQINAQEELGLFMLALGKGLSTGRGKELLLRLSQVNPWMFDQNVSDRSKIYQKGILQRELENANRYYRSVVNYKAVQ